MDLYHVRLPVAGSVGLEVEADSEGEAANMLVTNERFFVTIG
jgi:hypothetical protein